ncbi:hypothetical protein D3C78_1836010 [compost metagenome]
MISDPAQKAFSPAPVMTTQRMVSEASHSAMAASMALAMPGVTAFSFCGRFRVMTAT